MPSGGYNDGEMQGTGVQRFWKSIGRNAWSDGIVHGEHQQLEDKGWDSVVYLPAEAKFVSGAVCCCH